MATRVHRVLTAAGRPPGATPPDVTRRSFLRRGSALAVMGAVGASSLALVSPADGQALGDGQTRLNFRDIQRMKTTMCRSS